ncbi:hypothetical protein L484_008557 [Morus notabilis]|uniref:Uncharacterized protein n=1 Tax=Morus notabilis TaxID=981085 RepID=W9QQP5_9ROSA|nr:hypothetical protein L484_008557 [Morus notabilis]
MDHRSQLGQNRYVQAMDHRSQLGQNCVFRQALAYLGKNDEKAAGTSATTHRSEEKKQQGEEALEYFALERKVKILEVETLRDAMGLLQLLEKSELQEEPANVIRSYFLGKQTSSTPTVSDGLVGIASDSKKRMDLYKGMADYKESNGLHPLANQLALLLFLKKYKDWGLDGTEVLLALCKYEGDNKILELPLVKKFLEDLREQGLIDRNKRNKELDEVASLLEYLANEVRSLKS